ncbi:sulfatase family protein [Vallitalea okinawensis]|uniref:sulfatase family protein n=1 Tax=Vallitalea okinawensis TaxID=2078660 RepID=UPI000CFCFEBB|nr:sulfatase [Vallitalea okinawensis]
MKSKQKPNVIWIVADQLRASAIGCNGDPNAYTPNLDRLAALGVNFNRAVSGYPLCCPFRGSMLTSTYPHKCVPGHQYQMPENAKTIAHAFNEKGYSTSYFGKWHLDGFRESTGRSTHHIVPPHRRGGFSHWVGYENNNSQWDTWVHGTNIDKPYRLDGYETDVLTDMFITHMEEQITKSEKPQPFFSVLSIQPPHDPYVAPEQFSRNYNAGNIEFRKNVPNVEWIRSKASRELAGYYAQIENFDWNIGRIIEALMRNDLYSNTHIIIFSDHGDMQGSHGQYHKTTVYEESIRIPFIISGITTHYDGFINKDSDILINHVDIGPTSLGLCGIDKPDWMEGSDYSGYRLLERPKVDKPDSAFIQSVIPTYHHNSCDRPWRAVVSNDGWKYACFENSDWLLFNLTEDPFELVNMAHNSLYQKKRNYLKSKLKDWINRTGDNFRVPTEY